MKSCRRTGPARLRLRCIGLIVVFGPVVAFASEDGQAVAEGATPETQDASAASGMDATLTLAKAQEAALANNPTVMAAAARVKQARARVNQARSRYFPNVNLSYTASHTHLPDNVVNPAKRQALTGPLTGGLGQALQVSANTGGTGGGLQAAGFGVLSSLYSGWQARANFDEETNLYSASLEVSYVVFDGFSRHYANAMARFGRKESEAARQEVYRFLLDAVAQSFYGVQLARENVAIAEADEAFNKRLLKEAQLRRERGTGSKSDVLNFEVLLRAAQAARIRAESDRAVARVALAALMGLPDARLGDAVIVEPLPPETPDTMSAPAAADQIAMAAEMRPDMQQASWQLERLRAQVGERRSAYYPHVSAFASQDAQTTDNGRLEEDDFGHTVGLNLSYNLFAGGRNRAGVAEARYQLEEAELELAALRLDVAQQVRQALIELEAAQETLVLQRTTAEYVNVNRDLVEKEYRAGQGTLARLNQAQRDLVEAEARLALARVAVYSARHTLETATGETISRFGGYIGGGADDAESVRVRRVD